MTETLHSKGKKGKTFLSKTTVEPVVFLFVFASESFAPVMMNFIYQRVCLDRFPNETGICEELSNKSLAAVEKLVQADSSHWIMYSDYCIMVPALFVTFVYGLISDAYSQKLVMCLPLVAAALQALILLVMSVFPGIPLSILLMASVIFGLGGAQATFFMAMLGHVARIFDSDERTVRIAMADGMYSAGAAVAYFSGGVLFDHTGFTFVFSLVLITNILTIVYVCVFIKNIPITPDVLSVRSVLHTFKDSVRRLVQKRPLNRRFQIGLVMFVAMLLLFGIQPSWTLAFLYLKKQPLSWTQTLYGYFVGYRNAVEGIGLFILLPIMKYCFTVQDTVILCISLFTTGISQIFFSISTKTLMVFISPIIGIFGANMWVTQRSVISGLVDKNEIGKIFALFGCLQSISALVGDTVYNNVYPLTLRFWPGFIFTLGGCILICANFIICWLHYDIKMRTTYHELLPNDGRQVLFTAQDDVDLILTEERDLCPLLEVGSDVESSDVDSGSPAKT